MITKRTLVTPAAPGTQTPLWSRFLFEITEGDPDLIDFLQAWAGYNLTGDTSEERFVFLYGPGGNGKGTFLGALSAILADYAARAPADMLLQRKHAAHETEIARLAGVRCLVASEAPDNRAFNMERIKDFVGGDGKLIGRFMHKDHFEFHAQFKLTLVGNQLPRFVPIDDGVRRRILIVPLMFVPGTPDTGLKAALVAEYPGILRWLIEGEQLRRAAGGLSALIPTTVAQATDRYLADNDPLDDFRAWAQECCEFGGGWKVKSSEALMSHETWCNLNGVFCDVTSRDFKEKFLQAYPHCTTKREMTGVVLGGVRLKGSM
jgi:putative DNA primase/helicase